MFSSVQALSRVQLFATPWITARQASLSITNSQSSLRFTSIESVIPSSHLILGRPLLLLPQSLPTSKSFPMSHHGLPLVVQVVKTRPAMQATRVQSLGQKDPLEKGMANHNSFLAWRIPWTEEPVELQSMGLQSQTQLWAQHTHYKEKHEMSYCGWLIKRTLLKEVI